MFNCSQPQHIPSPSSLSSFVAGLLVSGFLLLTACTSAAPHAPTGEQPTDAPTPPTIAVPAEAEVLDRDEVDQAPLPVGGMMTLYEEVRYPYKARQNKEQGRVLIQFVVGPDGTVYAPEILESATRRLDNEVMRVVTTLDWKPGTHNGEPVYVRVTLPASFDV